MATQASPVNFFTQQDPSFVQQQMQAQRMQKIADMLTDQGSSPIEYDHAGLISPWQGLAKMLQAYGGKTLADKSIEQQAKLQAQGAQAMARAYGMGSPDQYQNDFGAGHSALAQTAAGGGQSGPTRQAAALADQLSSPSNQGGARPSPLNPYGAPPLIAMAAAQGDPAAKAQLDYFLKERQTPDAIKVNQWAGITPAQANAKDTSIMVKPNNSLVGFGADGKPSLSLVAPDIEGNLQTTVGPNGQVSASGIPGVVPARAALEASLAGAKADQAIGTVTAPNGAQVPTRMGPAANVGQQQLGISPANNGYADGGTPQSVAGEQIRVMQSELNNPNLTSDDRAGIQREIARLQGADPRTLYPGQGRRDAPAAPTLGADPTIQTARTNQQTAMADKWKPLNEAVSNAQTINSRLDTIKDLSTRASTGQLADKIQFANSLLALAGSERANDANTAKVLIDKNANQIVAQLGQGGLATDAARAILQSAYPNSHMPKEAIAEAADNLKAANSMMVAKARVLQPHYQQNDPVGYQQKETAFNSVADPRLFQLKSQASDQQLRTIEQWKKTGMYGEMMQKAQALKQMGAL